MGDPGDVPPRLLPLTYDECRARFRHAVAAAALPLETFTVAAKGPEGQTLSIDATTLGPADADRLLLVTSGVHGVEGFVGSALQCDLLDRLRATGPPEGMAVLLVHAVNPWGMAWWRRENESNVDLNRNWRRSDVDPPDNDAYDELHPLACPNTATMPALDSFLATANAVVAERGLVWVRDAITVGQYRHPDGLHYGGARTEESTAVIEALATERVTERSRLLVLDLHTGHGRRGEITLLSDRPPDDPQHRFFRASFPGLKVEATVDNPDATTGRKSGQIANGIRDLLPAGAAYSTSAEIGTANDIEQLTATYLSRWVHFHGDRTDPSHAAAIWAYRCCFTPDDRAWEQAALARGRALLDQAVAAVARWPDSPAPHADPRHAGAPTGDATSNDG